MNRNYRKILLGLGFDSKDGHLRITKGDNFRLFGGSEETHEMMQEKAIKFNEQLDKRHKNIEEINEEEFFEISQVIGLKLPDKGREGKK
ncbi:MAG: hypothetical protein PHI58_04985 [Candidatus Omnitrophica bacterium]|nr:hypothetical protein [Candidatus Omnitrophota bacterium]